MEESSGVEGGAGHSQMQPADDDDDDNDKKKFGLLDDQQMNAQTNSWRK